MIISCRGRVSIRERFLGGATAGRAPGRMPASPLEEITESFGRFQLNLYEDVPLSSRKISAYDCL